MQNYDSTPESDLAPPLPTAEGPGRGPSLQIILSRQIAEIERCHREIEGWRNKHLSARAKSARKVARLQARASELEKLLGARNA